MINENGKDNNMQKEVVVTGFRLYRMGHSALRKKRFAPVTERELTDEGLPVCEASVPGCVERDLGAAGVFPTDVAYGNNILQCAELERTHFWYAATFEIEETEQDVFLCFGGIDTVAEIFVDGREIGRTENMLIAHEFSLADFEAGSHELLVHIIPVSVYSMNREYPVSARALRYNLDSLCVRKSPSMYGWDIMPRAVSAGLWRDVTVCYRPASRLRDVALVIKNLDENEARLELHAGIYTEEDNLRQFSIRVRGVCEESVFEHSARLIGVNHKSGFTVAKPKIWEMRGRGKQYLYTVTVTLLCGDTQVDKLTFNTGLRTVYLDRSSVVEPGGRFRFIVNGKPVFILGTNLVPNDMFPAVGDTLFNRETELVRDIGCNMVRIWGGGVYRCDEFYDWCDENGILVWQDFMMACGCYPQDPHFSDLLREEAVSVIKRLRHHPSIALWSGDNECDGGRGSAGQWAGTQGVVVNPNDNTLTREVLPRAVADYDSTRPYLPSSPYRDEYAFAHGGYIAEDHLWGPRDWFKGDYYVGQSKCYFASETGYHGCPSPDSLRQFIRPGHLSGRGNNKVCEDEDWLLHAANPEAAVDAAYAYRIPLMTRQAERLFGKSTEGDSLDDYALKSQISQAEAVKFFIEHFRAEKGCRSGIIWWNIIDGWPQISDAVVDYYGRKKLAYSYIKCSQSPVCLLFDEPDENGTIRLIAVNDTPEDVTVSYRVTDGMTDALLLSGTVTVAADGKGTVRMLSQDTARFLRIFWDGDHNGENHFVTRIGDDLSFGEYRSFMTKAGFDRSLEGFGI